MLNNKVTCAICGMPRGQHWADKLRCPIEGKKTHFTLTVPKMSGEKVDPHQALKAVENLLDLYNLDRAPTYDREDIINAIQTVRRSCGI